MDPVPTPPAGISVVLPCLNEEASLGAVIAQARAGIVRTGLPGEIIVVDNGSSDGSAAVARAHGARLIIEPHRGYGSALRRGFDQARYDLLVMADADLSYDLSAIAPFVAPIRAGAADVVIGNRMRSIEPGAMPGLHRYLGNPVLSAVLRLLFRGRAVHDAHCGMRAITRAAYRRLHCVTTGMEFASEMIVQAIRARLRIAECEVRYRPRVGASKLRSFRDGWRHLRFMILHSPTLLLLIPGLAAWFAGLLIALPLAFGPLFIHGRRVDIHCMLIGGVLNIVGIQIVTIGLLAKAYGHLSGLTEDRIIAWFYRWFTFEKALLVSAAMLLAGLALTIGVTAQWIASGFGALDQQRLLFFALICVVNGVQLGAASFLFSIMALPRHLDRLPPASADTGIVDT